MGAVLSLLGSIVGVLVGVGAGYALSRDWRSSRRRRYWAGVGVAAVVGALTGAYSAGRPARLSPTEALACAMLAPVAGFCGVPVAGSVTVTTRPPPSRGRACT